MCLGQMVSNPGITSDAPIAFRVSGAGTDDHNRRTVRQLFFCPGACHGIFRDIPAILKPVGFDAAGLQESQEAVDDMWPGAGGDPAIGEQPVAVPGSVAVETESHRSVDTQAGQARAQRDLHKEQAVELTVFQGPGQIPVGAQPAVLPKNNEFNPFKPFYQCRLGLADDPGQPCIRPAVAQGVYHRQYVRGVGNARHA